MAAINDSPALERVTYRPRIVGLLQQIQESRTIVTVHLKDDNNRYTSAILSVNDNENTLALDELNPKSGHERLAKVRHLNISARLAGVNIYFKADVQSIEQENGIALYRIPIPDRLLYEQKRGAFRVRISAGMQIPITLRNGAQVLLGHLTDISSTGIGALIESADPIELGTHFDYKIVSTSAASLTGSLEIRFSKLDEQLKLHRIGAQMINTTPAHRAQMERFVMSLQREIIKRNKDK